MYSDRMEAGQILANALLPYGHRNTIIFGIPRGGMIVAAQVAWQMRLPLDVVIVRKLGMPKNPEFAMGAIGELEEWKVVLNKNTVDENCVSRLQLSNPIQKKHNEIKEMRSRYGLWRPGISVEHKQVVIVDDGIATGATMRAAIQLLRKKHPSRIIAAAPVGALESVSILEREADAVVCPWVPQSFEAIGQCYADFLPVSDEEAINCLQWVNLALPQSA